MAAAVAAVVLGGWLASTLVLWWDTGAIGAARVDERAGAFESGGHADYRVIQGY